jgi:MFS transporter, DHA1 family, tetracycline resistance protein
MAESSPNPYSPPADDGGSAPSVSMGPQAAPNPGAQSAPSVSMGPQAAPNPGALRAPKPAPSLRPLIPIFIIVFIDVMGLTLIIPILPYYAQKYGASDIQIGLLLSCFAICQFFASPFLGRLSDEIGRKPVLIFSQIGMAASYLILAFAGPIASVIGLANALPLIYVGRIVAGITAANLAIAQAYISDVTRPEDRTSAYGVIGIAFGLGFMIGPPIAGIMSSHLGPETPFHAAGALSLASAVTTSLLLPGVKVEVNKARRRLSRLAEIADLFQRPETRRRLIEFFVYQLAFTTMMSGFAVFLQHMYKYNERDTGFMFLYSGAVGIVVQGGFLGRMVRRLGEERLALLGFLVMGLGFAFVGVKESFVGLLVMTLLGTVGGAVTRPALTTLLTKSVDKDEQGKALGVSTSLTSVAQIVCPVIATGLIQLNLLVGYGLAIGLFSVAGAALVARRSSTPPSPPQDVGASPS